LLVGAEHQLLEQAGCVGVFISERRGNQRAYVAAAAVRAPGVFGVIQKLDGYVGICCWRALKILYILLCIQFSSGAHHETSRPKSPRTDTG
jgi:hypothetical protein